MSQPSDPSAVFGAGAAAYARYRISYPPAF